MTKQTTQRLIHTSGLLYFLSVIQGVLSIVPALPRQSFFVLSALSFFVLFLKLGISNHCDKFKGQNHAECLSISKY